MQWQAIYAARWRGASWEQITGSLRIDVEEPRAGHVDVIGRQERPLGRDIGLYHAML